MIPHTSTKASMQNHQLEILDLLGSAANYLSVKALHDITTMLMNRSR